MPKFDRYIGIDYSGAATASTSLKGLRIYAAELMQTPVEILPPPGPRKFWTRHGVAEWLAAQLRSGGATLVGIDHAFSFPLRYFETHRIPGGWPEFLDDFQRHWPTDAEQVRVEDIRRGLHGDGASRGGDARWRRLTEQRCRAKSVFHFDVQGSVAKSTHAGLPWLRYLKRELGASVHFWPFDGWKPPRGRSVIAEVYPSLSSKSSPSEGRTPDQHDAYSAARWLQMTDINDFLDMYFQPMLNREDRPIAELEGWILGGA